MKIVRSFCVILMAGLLVSSSRPVWASDLLEQVHIQQNLKGTLPLTTSFYDENGKKVTLGRYFRSKPVLLTFVYYNCPMLCSLNLKSLARSLKDLDMDPGKDYELLVISFDPNDIGGNAQGQLEKFMKLLNRPGTQGGIHFLTGTLPSIRKTTEAAGFQYVKNEENGQYAHTTTLIVLTPQGVISRYLFGLDYPSRDIKLALTEARRNKTGSLAQQILLYCFLYHPQTGHYTLAILNILKIAALFTILVLVVLVYLLKRQEKRA